MTTATLYQITKTNLISADRHGRGTSAFSAWVRKHYAGKFIVAVSPYDVAGQFTHEPLKNRGYEFSGAGSDHIERELLVGKKNWFRAFDAEQDAEDEITTLTETGI
jgi:hypothetical protein